MFQTTSNTIFFSLGLSNFDVLTRNRLMYSGFGICVAIVIVWHDNAQKVWSCLSNAVCKISEKKVASCINHYCVALLSSAYTKIQVNPLPIQFCKWIHFQEYYTITHVRLQQFSNVQYSVDLKLIDLYQNVFMCIGMYLVVFRQ